MIIYDMLRFKFNLILSLLLATTLCFILLSVNSDIEIRYRVTEYPPQYFQKNGEWTGFDVEIMKIIIKEAGYKAVPIDLPWSRALNYLECGELHLMSALSKTDERSVYLNWLGPVRDEVMSFITSDEFINEKIDTLEDLLAISAKYRLKIGIQNNVFYSKEFNEKLKDPEFIKYFEFIEAGSLQAEKTLNRRILGFIENRDTWKYMINNTPGFKRLAIHTFILSSSEVYIGVSKKVDQSIYKNLEKAVKKLLKNGEINKIMKYIW